MSVSKVYFTDMRCKVGTSLLEKLDKLMIAAGIGEIDFENKFVAIKLHFGEPGNLSFLRPNFAKAVADRVKALGGRPFLTDCNTLYVGRRKDALEHMTAANENGFSMLSTGCQIIIGDGLKGTDDVEVPVNGGRILRTAFIGRAVMDADIFISLTHFKGHELTGFGGAIKNIGIMRNAWVAAAVSASATSAPLQAISMPTARTSTAAWRNMPRRWWTGGPISMSASSIRFPRAATATVKMMPLWCRISACSPVSIRSRWIMPALMP